MNVCCFENEESLSMISVFRGRVRHMLDRRIGFWYKLDNDNH